MLVDAWLRCSILKLAASGVEGKQQVWLPSVSAPSCPHVVLVLGAVFLDVDLDVVLDPVVPQQVSNLGVVLDLVVWCS